MEGCPHLLRSNQFIPIQAKKQQNWKARTSLQCPTSGYKQKGVYVDINLKQYCDARFEVLQHRVWGTFLLLYDAASMDIWLQIFWHHCTDTSIKLTSHRLTQHHIPDDLNLQYHLTAVNSYWHQNISWLIQSQTLHSLN
jgi:hypothetical protein